MPRRAEPLLNTADNHPLAYLLTFTTYGTWLHGDERGSVDRFHASLGSEGLDPNFGRERMMRAYLKHPPLTLNSELRHVVEEAIADQCRHRGWVVEALNVRTNHVHVVVAADARPERVLNELKSRGTRLCREAGHIARDRPMWTRHGSTRYLWTERAVEDARRYVLHGQGAELE